MRGNTWKCNGIAQKYMEMRENTWKLVKINAWKCLEMDGNA